MSNSARRGDHEVLDPRSAAISIHSIELWDSSHLVLVVLPPKREKSVEIKCTFGIVLADYKCSQK